MKKILLAVLAVLVVLVALVLAHPLWISPVVKTAVSLLAPKFLGVPAHLDGFSLNAYKGRLTLDGFVLDNPSGCNERKFVSIGHLCVDLDPMSLASDVIVVEEVSMNDFFVSLVTDDKKVYNFKTVADACSSPSEPDAVKAEPASTVPDEEKKPGRKVIVDLIQVQNALVQWESVKLPLPSFRLSGLGRDKDGVEFEAAWDEVESKFIASLGPLAKGLQTALATGQSSLDAGLKAATEATKSAAETTKALDDVSKALKDGSNESVDAAIKSTKDAAKSIEGSVKSLKSLFGK